MATADLRTAKIATAALAVAGVGLSAFWLAQAAVVAAKPETVWVAPLPVMSAGPTVVGERATIDTSLDIFDRGGEVEAEPVIATVGEDAPETTLDLVLKGLRAGPNGSAFIQTPDRKTTNYYLGDEVVGGVTLEAVNADFVVIDRGGRLERLTIERTTVLERPATSPARTAAAPLRPASSKQQVGLGDLIRNVSFDRALEGGELAGYRISSANNAGATQLTAFGFEEGDIVTTINGVNLTRGGTDMLSVLRQFENRNLAVFLVRRGEDVMTIRVGG